MIKNNFSPNAIAEGIIPIYKSRKIELEIGYWEIYGTCNGCVKKDFFSIKNDAVRAVYLKVKENGTTTQYCSSCSIEALNVINKEAKKVIDNPELDKEAINQQIEKRQKQSREGN